MSAVTEKFFSATELSKFCYCKIQWYYERTYGAKQLNEWRKERSEAMGWDAGDAFAKGRKFHEGYVARYTARRIIKWAAVILLILTGLYLYFILSPR